MKKTFLLPLLCLSLHVAAQDFMLQGWYWNYPKTCDGYNWADTLNSKVAALSQAGFNYVWMPPLSRASFGSCSNGYDPKDLYDLGEYGGGPTGFGTRQDVQNLVATMQTNGIFPVADVVYNHRDGGKAEVNHAVRDYITNYFFAGKSPFPSDRFRCILPVGGSSGNGAGHYYFKVSSKTQDPGFYDKPYRVYMNTNVVNWQNLPDSSETEPNGGGDCGEGNMTITLGRNFNANVDGLGCKTDEFHLYLAAADFNPAGDTLVIYLSNLNNNYSDHRIYGIWRQNDNGDGGDIASQVIYQTYTDFTSLPSGKGSMNFENFKPNSGNTSTTYLSGDWDYPWFFYDYDQNVASTRTALFDWSDWLWDSVGIRGYRMDAVKHFDPAFTGDLLDHLHSGSKNPGLVVGEYFDSNPNTLRNWINNVYAGMNASTADSIKVRAFDFSLRQALKEVCDNGADTRTIYQSGIVDGAGGSGFNAITFLNNHDFRDGTQPVQNNTMLAYAYLLTNNQVGLPCVFYPEYSGDSVANYPVQNLSGPIDQLIALHKTYIYQSAHREYLNQYNTSRSNNYVSGDAGKTVLFQLSGGVAGKDVLIAINFDSDTLEVTHELNMDLDGQNGNNFNAGDIFMDALGRSETRVLTVSNANSIHLKLAPFSYSVWVQGHLLCNITDIALSDLNDCDDRNTPFSSDDRITADVTVNFDDVPVFGHLRLSGSTTAVTPVGSISGNSYTFNNVIIPANGASINITAAFTADTTCSNTETGLASAPPACSCTPVINEIDYDQPGVDTAEFVELYNPCSEPVNLQGVKLVMANSAGTLYRSFSLGNAVIPAHGYYVICANNSKTPHCNRDVSPNLNLIQNTSPAAVALVRNTEIMDAVSYEGSVPGYVETNGDGLFDSPSATLPWKGIARFPNGLDTGVNSTDFKRKCITPGAANLFQSTGCQPSGFNGGNPDALLSIDEKMGSSEVIQALQFSLHEMQVNMFPNPASGEVIISIFEDFHDAELKVTDMHGRVMLQRSITADTQIAWNVSSWAAGLYFVAVQVDGKLVVKKLAVE